MRGTGHRDETGDHKYFSQIPHLLDDSELTAHEVRLYLHYKRVCSPNEVCYESVRTSAGKCGMDPHTVIRSRNVLAEKGWIAVELSGTGRGHTVSVTLIDRWQENMERYSKGGIMPRLTEERGPMQRNVAEMQQKRGRDAIKEEPIKKNDLRRDPSPSERAAPKIIDLDFLGEMVATFKGVDVQRELAKFNDWKEAKGRRFKDDRAAFRNWLRKAEEYAGERKQRDTAKAGRGAIRSGADLNAWDNA